ncbi:hypothetical protein A5844_000265 [Enterococcus sp. 10A9_DIV0425]|uniref:HTH gntR-type domain-containing protein n=1 Tax=Candidatus Enterococcus wittei TaxID=1987383 RepID=A0A2C9XPE7_9ENTE|nr:PLP-dependent aminotransferase family protein [Enterococcus sp. 10A9_DIV0425]OTP12050.1 hypothetical protein A5844_000265 [Enterococcus sp. 10A9_DIV0425]THE07983.1 PLP-dependent aminotransferase family protein [Enterococcus hirae]
MWEKVDKRKGSAYRQIMDQIIKEIENGHLSPGERLPSERNLAESFQVNRTTVVHALDELRALGIIASQQGSGRFVRKATWGEFTEPRIDWRQLISQRYEKLTDNYEEKIKEARRQSDFIDLYSSEMPLELLPNFQIPTYSLEEILQEEQFITAFGYRPLIEKVSNYLKNSTQILLDDSRLLITSGGQQAIFLVLQTILSMGEAIAVETPSFFYRLPLFKAIGIRLFGIPMDEEGIDLVKLEEAILKHQIKAILVNPNFQNPTGKVMSYQRRKELVDLCRKYQLPIIEDDVFADLKLSQVEKATIPSLYSIDPKNVLYIGSLSLILGKTTKIGWILGPRSFVGQLAEAQKMMEFSMSIFTQVVACAVFDETFERKIKVLRNDLRKRSGWLENWANAQTFFDLAPIYGGYYAWISWKGRKLTNKLAEKIIDEGVGIAPNFLFGEETNGFRINFSRLKESDLPRFADVMDQLSRWLAE